MTFGTLEYKKEQSEEQYIINAEFEVELMIKRLIPSHLQFPLRVRVHPENTKILKMVMSEYPLEIKTKKYEKSLNEIGQREELKKKIQTLNHIQPDKSYFLGKLLPFQELGLDFLQKTNGNTLVADEMGLGKTIEALSYIATMPDKMPIIIVTPLVTLINWKREIEKFIALGNRVKMGNQTMLLNVKRRTPIVNIIRTGKPSNLEIADFILINYELVPRRIKDLMAINPKLIVFDECHYLRNSVTDRYQACKFLASHDSVEHRIGLSGTPIYNKGMEMYNICEVIKTGLLGDPDEFIRRYCKKWNSSETEDNAKSALSTLLKNTIMIRRKKTEVLKDLPDKIRMKQSIQINTDFYEAELEKLYEKIEIAKEQLKGKLTDDQKKDGLFELNKQIREMRLHERQIAGLAKAPFVVEYMNNLLEDYDEEKFVIFCHHLNVRKALYDGLWRYNPVQIGSEISDKGKQEAIDSFQKDDKTRVILCGLRAGNVGITLTRASYVIFAELDWTPSVHKQAEDRLHRIGQKNTVFAHYLEGIGTFDEKLADILLNKTVIINDALGDKMEHMDNQTALKYLDDKFKTSKKSVIMDSLSVNDFVEQ